MATTHVKTVTVFPSDDAYAWSNVDDVTSAAATWLTITQQGATDNWDFVVEENLTYSTRSATCTVTHSNGTTDESFTIDLRLKKFLKTLNFTRFVLKTVF